MKHILIISTCSILAFGQQPRLQRTQPSDLMTKNGITLPAQDITITIHVSSEMATALEKKRVDNFMGVVNPNNSMSLQPKFKTLADQILFDMRPYFTQVLATYPGASVKAAQDAAATAQKAAQDAADKPGVIEKK